MVVTGLPPKRHSEMRCARGPRHEVDRLSLCLVSLLWSRIVSEPYGNFYKSGPVVRTPNSGTLLPRTRSKRPLKSQRGPMGTLVPIPEEIEETKRPLRHSRLTYSCSRAQYKGKAEIMVGRIFMFKLFCWGSKGDS